MEGGTIPPGGSSPFQNTKWDERRNHTKETSRIMHEAWFEERSHLESCFRHDPKEERASRETITIVKGDAVTRNRTLSRRTSLTSNTITISDTRVGVDCRDASPKQTWIQNLKGGMSSHVGGRAVVAISDHAQGMIRGKERECTMVTILKHCLGKMSSPWWPSRIIHKA